ncbi:DeoR family transcriptional regulator [Gracilibacillus sp. JCM 18860]|uniref:DeoR family transcriptional regulator n=1 Tax=Gracilibacillus sp. JCM 18860 TaxID=1306159 RepID=UPI0006D2C175
MFPLERQNKMLELLKLKKVLKMTELKEELNISMDTLRRDIQSLVKQEKVEKIYGGGIKLKEYHFGGESSMEERMVSNLQEKQSIAYTCSKFIQDGDCVFLDSGSTTYQIAKFLQNKKKLTVITNSFPVALELLNSDIELIIIGGKVRKEERSIVSYEYLFNFSQLNIQKAFICASGITLEKGISDYNVEEAITRKKMIELSSEIYVAADSTKFGKDVTVGIAPLSEIDHIVTDQNVDKTFTRAFEQINTNLIISNM